MNAGLSEGSIDRNIFKIELKHRNLFRMVVYTSKATVQEAIGAMCVDCLYERLVEKSTTNENNNKRHYTTNNRTI